MFLLLFKELMFLDDDLKYGIMIERRMIIIDKIVRIFVVYDDLGCENNSYILCCMRFCGKFLFFFKRVCLILF